MDLQPPFVLARDPAPLGDAPSDVGGPLGFQLRWVRVLDVLLGTCPVGSREYSDGGYGELLTCDVEEDDTGVVELYAAYLGALNDPGCAAKGGVADDGGDGYVDVLVVGRQNGQR